MLNELEVLRRSLARYGVPEEETHPWVKRLARSPTVWIGLDAAGKPSVVELIGAERAVELFKIQESFHSNFPAMNVTAPVCRLAATATATQRWLESCKERKKKSAADAGAGETAGVRIRARLLREACEGVSLSERPLRDLERAQTVCQGLKPRFSEREGRFAAFVAVMERLLAVSADEEWFRALTKTALDAAEEGSATLLETVELLLAGKYDRDSGKFKEEKIPVLLDVADYQRFDCRVADPRMGGYYSRRLSAPYGEEGEAGRCSLTGREMPLETHKLPSPLLPVLGPTVLMSMNPYTPCQRRYGRIGTDVFRVGKRTAEELDRAVKQLTASGREFKNWQRVPGTLKGKSNLLLAYLEGTRLGDEAWASLFAEPEEAEENYGEICGKISAAMRGRESHGSERLRVFVLSRIDKGRVRVELSRTFTAEQVLQGGREWEIAARNRPEPVLQTEPEVPFPSQLVRCTQTAWIRGGKEATDAPGCGLSEVYDLLIADMEGREASARAMLRLVLARTEPLLTGLGHAAHREARLEIRKEFVKRANESAPVAMAVLAIALFRLGIKKEAYMKEAAYELGRFLSLVDTLHRQYCVKVRKNEIPPQLLGNAVLPRTAADPKKGLARILDRIGIYQAWAQTDGTKLARWTLGEMGKLTPTLAEGLPERMDDAGKAQLLLGYLARWEKKEGQEEGTEEADGRRE
ncbi:MAG: hypothetical protein ACLQGV_17365 [Bryobacteraceae bacterium]